MAIMLRLSLSLSLSVCVCLSLPLLFSVAILISKHLSLMSRLFTCFFYVQFFEGGHWPPSGGRHLTWDPH